jgi:hypothetical protein
MDLQKALMYPFDDDDVVKKLGIGVGITLLAFTGIGLIAIPILLGGWQYEIMKNVRNRAEKPLAGWDDFGAIGTRGLTLFGAWLMYMAPVVLFACVWACSFFILPALASNGNAASGVAGMLSLVMTCCWCVLILYMIPAGVVYAGGLMRYLDKEDFSTFMEFGENFALVQNNLNDFGTALLFLIIGGFIGGAISSTGCGGLLSPTFNSYYSGHILGQLALKLKAGAVPAV